MWYYVLFGVIFKSAYSANILFITALPSPSHHIWTEVLVEGLLVNGHNITLLGYEDPNIKSTNYTIIKLNIPTAFNEETQEDLVSDVTKSTLEDLLWIWSTTLELTVYDLKSDALNILLNYPVDMFDLIVYDMGYGQHFYPLAEHFNNPPVIGISPFGMPPYIADAFGNNFYPYFPLYLLPYTDDMTFFQRLENTFLYTVSCGMKWYYTRALFAMAQERFRKNIVPFDKVEQQITLLLANYDPVLDFPQPLPPHIIPVGGLNVKPPKILPDEYKQILDMAKDGAIYFALGTNIHPSVLPKEKKQMLLDTFSKLNQIVLWKYDGDDLTNVPKNVIIKKWYPQNDILGHANVKLFITHNGALSTHEAMYHGVPVVGIPFYMDQINNAAKIEGRVLGKRVNFRTFTSDILFTTIQEVLQNPIYKQNMKKLSSQFRDKLVTPKEKAVYWVEYVLRHKDIRSLSAQGRYMPFYARENLDVIAFILMLVFIFLYFLAMVLKFMLKKTIFKKAHKIKQN